jgi:hypothetical protein
MARKQHFLIVDTETTIRDTVADFAGVICDRHGIVSHQIAVLVSGHFGRYKLFYDVKSEHEIWTLKGLKRRTENYKDMLNDGRRMKATPNAINKWLAQAKLTFPDLIFCAYNSKFDIGKMANTGIDTEFKNYFCIMRAFQNTVKGDKKYIQHCLDRKWLTAKLNFRTNAEAAAEFVSGGELMPEPHTALEDIMDYELPIFKWLLKKKSWKKYSQLGYSWRDWQLNQLVTPK